MLEQTIHKRQEIVRSKVLHAAAKLFLNKGYVNSTLRQIATLAEVNYGSMMFAFRSKEEILSELVGFVLEGQFEATEKLLTGKTEAFNDCLQGTKCIQFSRLNITGIQVLVSVLEGDMLVHRLRVALNTKCCSCHANERSTCAHNIYTSVHKAKFIVTQIIHY